MWFGSITNPTYILSSDFVTALVLTIAETFAEMGKLRYCLG